MPERKVPKNATEMVDALFDFVQGPEEDVREVPIEKVLKNLEKQRLDPVPLVSMVRERLAAARAEQSLRDARQERERIARLVAERPAEKPKGEDFKRQVLDILHSKPELAPAYRKFEEATDADLQSLLQDLDLLEGVGGQDDE